MLAFFVSCKKDKQIEPLNEERFANLSYGPDSLQTLDIKLPANRDEKTPVVFLVHGGGWIIGKKEDMSLFEDVFFKKGFVVVSINYRLANSLVRYNEINSDIIAAVNYIDSHLHEYHISNRKYSMLGFSAGAQLAMLYAYKNSNIKSVVSIAGPNNLYNPFYQQGYITTSIEAYTGYAYGTNAPSLIINSPYYYATNNSPSTYFLHGNQDLYVDVNDSRSLHNKLDSLGVTNVLEELPTDHIGVLYYPTSKFEVIADWVKYTVK